MALEFANNEEGEMSGMTLAIYRELDNQLSPPLLQGIEEAEDEQTKDSLEKALDDAREIWEKISYAIAAGVIQHIQTNMEIHDIETEGEVDGDSVRSTQIDGTGHVK